MNTIPMTAKVPAVISDCIEARWRSLGYQSRSAYFCALAIYDLMCMQPHKVTPELAAMDLKDQDAILAELAKAFNAGERVHHKSWFKKMVRDTLKEEAPPEPLKPAPIAKLLDKARKA